MFIRSNQAVCCAAMAGLISVAAAGPDWTEVGDAGNSLSSAQIPAGNGQIQSISGRLGAEGETPDMEDMYIIGIDQPTAFHLELAGPGFDAQLFIFNITLSGGALGLLANDNANANTTDPILTPISTDGSNAILDLPGVYLIGVSGIGRNPVSASGLIFDIQSPTEISGADGPGGLLRFSGWEGVGATGDYAIMMDGTIFPQIPAPASIVLLVSAGLIGNRRRRG